MSTAAPTRYRHRYMDKLRRDIARLDAQGKSAAEIARKVGRSEGYTRRLIREARQAAALPMGRA